MTRPRSAHRRPPEARLAVNLPKELHREIKVRAAEEGLTMREYLLTVLRRAGIGK